MIFTPEMYLLALGFFFIAAIYSSVGFGGGSSYLALLAVLLPNFTEIRSTALLCNLVVVTGSCLLFYKEGHFNFRKFWPLVLCSVPAAFAGASLHLSEKIFFICLGGVLAFSGLLLIIQHFFKTSSATVSGGHDYLKGISLGAGAGFISGLVGIGGGILISPVLHLMRWDAPRKIAALSAFFILVNSMAGLAGQFAGNTFNVRFSLLALLLPAVFLGGQVGTRLSLKKINPEIIKFITGILVFYIGANLIFKYAF